MKESTKQFIDQTTGVLIEMRRTNNQIYWATLTLGGLLLVGIMTLLLKVFGLVVLIVFGFIYIVNKFVNDWERTRRSERAAVLADERKSLKKQTIVRVKHENIKNVL
jgi:uncharacterized membrane protein